MKTALKRAKLRSVATSKGKDARRMQNSLKKTSHSTLFEHICEKCLRNLHNIQTRSEILQWPSYCACSLRDTPTLALNHVDDTSPHTIYGVEERRRE